MHTTPHMGGLEGLPVSLRRDVQARFAARRRSTATSDRVAPTHATPGATTTPTCQRANVKHEETLHGVYHHAGTLFRLPRSPMDPTTESKQLRPKKGMKTTGDTFARTPREVTAARSLSTFEERKTAGEISATSHALP